MRIRNWYILAGISLLISGGAFTAFSYFILNIIWTTALGTAITIIALILIALGSTVPRLPPEFSSALLETGVNNISAIIEELGIRSKAVYLPPSANSGGGRARIPLDPTRPPLITRALPERFIVRYGDGADDIGLLVATAGTVAAHLLPSSPEPYPEALENTLTSLVRGTLGIADNVKVNLDGGQIAIKVIRPYIDNRPTWSDQCLASPLAAIVASVAAGVWGKPVQVVEESRHGGNYRILLKILE